MERMPKRRRHRWETRGIPKRMNLLKKSRRIQRWYLRNPWIRPMLTFNLAAIRIQALIRRSIVRTHGKAWRTKIKRKKGKSRQLDKYLMYLDRYSGRKRPAWLDDGFSSWCAVRIQSMWRMTLIRRKYLLRRDLYQIAALEIQSVYSQYLRTKFQPAGSIQQSTSIPPPTQMKTIESYASVIQRAWRAYCNIRVYRYLRDIILNKLHGLPADLLRSIIPMETDFLDRASGIHVRFRLGGSIFPPKIYYKIYTHRPLCDINAFAPRNYSTERRYQPDPLTLHNKPVSLSSSYPGKYANGAQSSFIRKIQSSIRVGRTFYDATITPPQAEGYDDWYQREDDRNNPWRPISTELEEIISPPPSSILLDKNETRQHNIQKELKRKKKADLTSSPNSAFHYSRLRRQQDILLEKKRRKREWMLKAYTLTAGSKGMVGGNDQEIRPADGDDNQSRKSDFVPGKDGNIEMCDSFSSRSEMPEQQQHAIRGKTALPLHPTPPIELPHNGEKDQLSHGFKFRYSQTNSQRKDTHQDVEDIGTDDALLKWSMALDYEEYSKGWLSMATSLPSEASYGTSCSAKSAAAVAL